jgi:Effector Associated Constant Component 1
VHEFVFEFEGSTADNDRAARDLVAWLNDNEDLRGTASVRMVGPGPGEQGAAADAAVVLASAAPLARPFFTWLTERVKSRRITLRITSAAKELKINVEAPADAEALLEQLVRLLDKERSR